MAMIIPVYLIYPLYYHWYKRKTVNALIFCGVILSVAILLSKFNPSVYTHLSQVLYSLILIAVGTQCADMVKKNQDLTWIAFLSILPYIIRILLRIDLPFLGTFSYALLGIFAAIICSKIIEKTPQLIQNLLKNLGSISLEMYLSNIFLIQAFHMFNLGERRPSLASSVIIYCGIVVVSFVWSFMTRYLVKRISA